MSAADVIIVDSGGANIASLQYALQRLGARASVSRSAAEIRVARRVLLPGVGAASNAMARLRAAGLHECLPQLTQPLLGICLGMQLLYEHSDEGDCSGLGVLGGRVQRMQPAGSLPVPHMGWNTLEAASDDPLLRGLASEDHFYFVHGFAAPLTADSRAATDYGGRFCAVVRRDNFAGVQFHPERSARAGARVLANFLDSRCD